MFPNDLEKIFQTEDAALEKLANFLLDVLKSGENNMDSNLGKSSCCCPGLIKFKVIGSTVVIINNNAECKRD
ncbi:MAG: hypothetical protein QHH10_03360 [Peptococcaceae bacterium]|nr:hypothetical protein [Peptococcaceae bacterium]MDH7524335.1 hypothetical protein [Peptococcaceae bacterium]